MTHHVQLPGVRLAVHTRGSGLPLLLLHAFPLDHSMWAGQDDLADEFRLIVPDQRGFGRSDGPPPASIAQLADDAVALLDALHVAQPAVIGGLSMGGYVAQHVAARHPDRVRALILADTRLEADTPEARATRGELAAAVGRLGPEVVASAMIPNLLARSQHARSNPARPTIEAALERTIRATPAATITAALAALGARPDMVDAMRRVGVPVLLVVGAEDTITPPACMERAEQVFERPRRLVIPHCGHLAPLEDAAAFNAAVRAFLREVAGAADTPAAGR
ncbi:MAG: alpha/beta fold hydrolase [Planctomycetia bacterium]|nr:alpha/beta fold hydrolase [Planctomycetia bacterium]